MNYAGFLARHRERFHLSANWPVDVDQVVSSWQRQNIKPDELDATSHEMSMDGGDYYPSQHLGHLTRTILLGRSESKEAIAEADRKRAELARDTYRSIELQRADRINQLIDEMRHHIAELAETELDEIFRRIWNDDPKQYARKTFNRNPNDWCCLAEISIFLAERMGRPFPEYE